MENDEFQQRMMLFQSTKKHYSRKRRRHCPEDEEEERQGNFREMDALQKKNKQLERESEEIREELELEQKVLLAPPTNDTPKTTRFQLRSRNRKPVNDEENIPPPSPSRIRTPPILKKIYKSGKKAQTTVKKKKKLRKSQIFAPLDREPECPPTRDSSQKADLQD